MQVTETSSASRVGHIYDDHRRARPPFPTPSSFFPIACHLARWLSARPPRDPHSYPLKKTKKERHTFLSKMQVLKSVSSHLNRQKTKKKSYANTKKDGRLVNPVADNVLYLFFLLLSLLLNAGQISNHLDDPVGRWQLHGDGNGRITQGPSRRLQFPHRPRHHAQGVRLPFVRELATAGNRRTRPGECGPVDQHAGRSRRPSPSRPPVGQQSQEGDRATLHSPHPQRVLSQRRLPAAI